GPNGRLFYGAKSVSTAGWAGTCAAPPTSSATTTSNPGKRPVAAGWPKTTPKNPARSAAAKLPLLLFAPLSNGCVITAKQDFRHFQAAKLLRASVLREFQSLTVTEAFNFGAGFAAQHTGQ